MKRAKDLSVFFLAVCMLISLSAFNPTYVLANTTNVIVSTTTPEQKINPDIWQQESGIDGKYLIYIQRRPISEIEISDSFESKNGIPLDYYEDREQYNEYIVPDIINSSIKEYGLDDAVDIHAGQELFNDNITPLQYELIANYNNYIFSKRETVNELYNNYNKRFIDYSAIDRNYIIYEGNYTGSYVVYATKEQIQHISQDNTVISIEPWVESYYTSDSNIVVDDTTHSLLSNLPYNPNIVRSVNSTSNSYKGTGVIIGIMEANIAGGKYDSNHPQLKATSEHTAPDLEYLDNTQTVITQTPTGNTYTHTQIVNSSVGEHATLVTSIIVGQAVTVNGVVYEGIVPNATAYQTAIENDSSVLNGIQLLASRGATVINMSAGSTDTGEYSNITKEVDALVLSLSITLVESAGNTERIGAPGNAYNIITVGNAATYNSSGAALLPPYAPYKAPDNGDSQSAWREESYLANKPDIMAPGTAIPLIKSDGSVGRFIGTSYSAPVITGYVAKLHQADSSLKDSIVKTKAVLLSGADPSKMSSQNNPAVEQNTFIRDKSGVGLADIDRSLEIAGGSATNDTYVGMQLDLSRADLARNHNMVSLYLEENQKIRIVLTFNKTDNTQLTNYYSNNADLRLYFGNSLAAFSSSLKNNVEVIEYTAEATGTYTICTYVKNYTRTSSLKYWMFSAAWLIE